MSDRSAPNWRILQKPASQAQDFDEPGPLSRRLVLSLLLFVLFAEWVLPLVRMSEMTQLYRIEPIIAAIACFLLVGIMRIPWWVACLLNGLVCFGLVAYLFHAEAGLPMLDWCIRYITSLPEEAARLLSSDISALTGPTRTLILFAGWAMFVSSVQSFVLYRQRGLLFVGATLIYLFALQLWPGVDTTAGLIRAAAEGLLFLALLRIPKLERLLLLPTRRPGWPVGWLAASAAATCCGVAAAWLLAMPSDRPVEPVRWPEIAQAWNALPFHGSGSGSGDRPTQVEARIATTGYGFDDTNLGVQLAADNSVAFTAKSPLPTYWRGESKSEYTGKGWTQPDRSWLEIEPGAAMPQMLLAGLAQATPIEQEVALPQAGGTDIPIVAGGSVAKVVGVSTTQGGSFGSAIWYDAGTGAYRLKPDSPGKGTGNVRTASASGAASETAEQDKAALAGSPGETGGATEQVARGIFPTTNSAAMPDLAVTADAFGTTDTLAAAETSGATGIVYTLQVEVPTWDAEALRRDYAPVPEEISAAYLQLPDQLPERVSRLAASVVVGFTDAYDRVKAIESFLRQNYAYSLNSSEPAEGEDFVEHFLFTQKSGYCNHFSTAMTVMLRSIGIPARWVKGFAPGERDLADSSVYTVRNSDAHAWVEVYFPSYGWFAFEPTPGFTGHGSEIGGAAAVQAVPASTAVMPAVAGSPILQRMLEAQVNGIVLATEYVARWERSLLAQQNTAETAMIYGAIGLAACAALLCVLWLLRTRLQLRLLLFSLRYRKPSHRAIVLICDLLWSRVYRQYGRKSADQTHREFVNALRLPEGPTRDALLRFLREYEYVRYSGSSPEYRLWSKPQTEELCKLVMSLK